MAAIVGRALAVSWAMAPLLYPRSIQVGRLLGGLCALGWEIHVLCADPTAAGVEILRDDTLARCLPAGPLLHPVGCAANGAPWAQNWIEAATAAGRALFDRLPCDVLLSFAQPFEDHHIGQALQAATGLPWITHYSDPWVDSPCYAHLDPEQRRRAHATQRRWIETARAVIFTNRATLELVMGNYPPDWRQKALALPHCLDARVVRTVSPRAKTRQTRIAYVGNLFEGARTEGRLFDAFARVVDAVPQAADAELVFVGEAPPSVAKRARDLGLAERVSFSGTVSFQEAQAWMASADILLILDRPARKNVFFPSKLVEYLAWNKPVLGLTPTEGVTATILRRCGWPTADPDDTAGIARALTALLVDPGAFWGPQATRKRRAVLAAYDTDTVSRRFAALLKRVKNKQTLRPRR